MNPDIGVDHQHYNKLREGQTGYWKHMPAPQLRRRRLLEWAEKLQPRSICDFGCGNGELLRLVAQRLPNAQLSGIDVAENQITANREAYPAVEWHRADLASKTYENPLGAGVDLAISSEVIEHIEQHQTYVQNIFNSLNPGGALILSTQSGTVYPTEKYVFHVRHWPAEDMRQLLAQTGFNEIKVWNEGYPFHNLSKYIANRDPDKAVKNFRVAQYGPKQLAVCLALRFLFLFNSRTRGAQLFAVAKKPA